MQDTSFAITPDKEKQTVTDTFTPLGALLSYRHTGNTVTFTCTNGYVAITYYQADILRVVMRADNQPSNTTSFAVVKKPENTNLSITEDKTVVKIHSDKTLVRIHKQPFTICVSDSHGREIVSDSETGMGFNQKQQVVCKKKMTEADHFYGFGQKTGYLDKRGERMSMWNTDVFAPHNASTDELYQSIPYFLSTRAGKAYGIFVDNTSKTMFDLKSSLTTYRFTVDSKQLDYYLFIGPTAKDVLQQYTTITGKMALPPKWSLGYHQSRYSYKSEKEVRELVETFKAKRVPLDAIYLDIHYMDEYRVFTFDSNRFPNPKKLIEELRKDGIRVVPIVDPGVKADENYSIYHEGTNESHFCKYSKGDVYHGDVWPGRSAFPDFTNEKTRRWWGKQHKFYTDLGIEGVWNDMNEPSVFNETKTMDLAVIHENNGQPKTHGELHNIYGMMMGAATHEGLKDELANKRPFVLTRAGYAGIQRYATVWTGDNRSFWEHLQMALPMCMNLGLSGVAFCGPDVGGFANDSNGELLTRWTQVGLFTPYFRNHSVLDSIHQEPWSFGTRYEEIIKRYIEERYVWLPYLYNVFKEASRTGMPVMRPLFLEFPYDEQTVNIYDQFMIGEDVLVAPILTPSTNHRVVYLPEGTWIDYWTDQKRVGGKYHLVYADIDTLPIFIKEGAIIPLTAPKASTNEKDKQLFIHLYPQANESKSYTLYEDDGLSLNHETGACFECDIHMEASADQLTITTHEKTNGYSPDWEERIFIIHGAIKEENIRLNDKMQFVSHILIKDNAHDS